MDHRRKCLSHGIINEIISLMGKKVLRNVLVKNMNSVPSRYAVIADEATDYFFQYQTETLFVVLKDMLTLCALPLLLCRGHAYDRATIM